MWRRSVANDVEATVARSAAIFPARHGAASKVEVEVDEYQPLGDKDVGHVGSARAA